MKKKQPRRASRSRKGESGGPSDLVAPLRGMVEENKKVYVERHAYRDATAADFKGRDRKWYDAAGRELAELGYRPLGDIVDETVARAAGLVIVIRRFVSADGENAAAVYQFVQGRGKGKVDLRVCDIETELSDGSFLATSNAEASAAASMPPQIRSTKYPAETTIPELVKRHEAAKKKLLAGNAKGKGKGKGKGKLSVVEIRTAADYDAMQHRQEAIKAAFRQGIGYLDPAEVRRIAERSFPDDPAFAGVAAATADLARRQGQVEKENPEAGALISMLLGGGDNSPGDFARLVMGAVQRDHPEAPADKRDQIARTLGNLFNAGAGGDENAGMKNLFTLMGQLQELEPKEEKEARRAEAEKAMADAQAEYEHRRAEHAKERLARGLSEKAGTGKPEPEVLIHGLPVGEIDYKDKPGRTLTAMIKEINASKARRDAKILAKLPLGHSRVGGLPDLPPGRPWPTHDGRKIPFVAQLNLADFPRARRPLLPERGHLYAFALVSNDEQHWPPPVSVFLYEGDTKTLVRAPIPADDEIWPDWGDERVYEVLPATARPKGRSAKARSREFGETLGWIQGEVDDVFGTPAEIADARFEDGDDWINLLAIESEGSMQWSDCGHLYLLIRRSALERRDFSNVLAAVCSS